LKAKDKANVKEPTNNIKGRVLTLVSALQNVVQLINEFSTHTLATVVMEAEKADAEIDSFVNMGSVTALYKLITADVDELGLDDASRRAIEDASSDMRYAQNIPIIGPDIARKLYKGNGKSRKYSIAFSKLLALRPVEAVNPDRTDVADDSGGDVPAPALEPVKPKKEPKAPDNSTPEAPVSVTPRIDDSLLSRVHEIKIPGGKAKKKVMDVLAGLINGDELSAELISYIVDKVTNTPELAPVKDDILALANSKSV